MPPIVSNAADLKTIGLKATLPRLKILELFERSTVRHLSAEDIYRALANEGLDVGLATIYRVLTQFEQAGLLPPHAKAHSGLVAEAALQSPAGEAVLFG